MNQLTKFNSLLFNEETKLLESICQNLIYDSKNVECQRNTFTLYEYFRIHNNLPQLISFVFRQQLLLTEKGNVLFKDDGVFTTFLAT